MKPLAQTAGIDSGDYVVVDRSINAKHGHIVLAVVDGEFTIKRLFKKQGRTSLLAANPTYPNIELKDEQELRVWGVIPPNAMLGRSLLYIQSQAVAPCCTSSRLSKRC